MTAIAFQPVISALTNFPDGDKSNQFGLMTEEIAT